MNIKSIKTQLLETMENYFIAYKLQNNPVSFKIDKSDYSIYDPWDWDNYPCYSISIENNSLRYCIKGSINIRNGECVLQIKYDGKEAGDYLIDVYKRYNDAKLIRSGWVHFAGNTSIVEGLIYFNREQDFFEILKTYLAKI
jgi:hypothetical protein